MKAFLKDLRFMVRDAWQSRGGRKIPADDTLARTIRDSTATARGASSGLGGGMTDEMRDRLSGGS